MVGIPPTNTHLSCLKVHNTPGFKTKKINPRNIFSGVSRKVPRGNVVRKLHAKFYSGISIKKWLKIRGTMIGRRKEPCIISKFLVVPKVSTLTEGRDDGQNGRLGR